ncbi:hypothetical protein AALG83_05210 [Christensenellaceae bacterium 44-20]
MNLPKTCLLFGPSHLSAKARLRLAPALKEQLRRMITEQNCRAFRLCDGGSFSRQAGYAVLSLKKEFPEVCLFFDLPSFPRYIFPRYPWLNASLHALTPLLTACDYHHFVSSLSYIGVRKAAICHSISQSDLCLMYPDTRLGYHLCRFVSKACFFSDLPVSFLEI